MTRASSGASTAVGMALAAAFLWAAYYPLVLRAGAGLAPMALIVWPFLVGGVGFSVAAIAQGHGGAFWKLWGDPIAWGRSGLMVAMQLLVLAATYLAGPVDTALLSLVGDVVLTPILLALLFSEGAERIRTARFAFAIAVCTGGSILTIAASGEVRPLSGVAIGVAVILPVVIAAFFLATARATLRTPTAAIGAQSVLAAGIVTLAVAPVVPGGIGALLPNSAVATGALVALGVSAFFLGPWLYFAAIHRAGLVLPAVLMAAIPVFTLLLSWIFLNSTPPILGLAGIPIAVIGAFLATQGPNEPWTPHYEDRRIPEVEPGRSHAKP
ncbi:MAG: DMT family transporter [Thermoplasmata archaeon]|nr:DMT family transporter [Thermoplasmata archaeon]